MFKENNSNNITYTDIKTIFGQVKTPEEIQKQLENGELLKYNSSILTDNNLRNVFNRYNFSLQEANKVSGITSTIKTLISKIDTKPRTELNSLLKFLATIALNESFKKVFYGLYNYGSETNNNLIDLLTKINELIATNSDILVNDVVTNNEYPKKKILN